jgi:hypothetical protein
MALDSNDEKKTVFIPKETTASRSVMRLNFNLFFEERIE